MTIREQVESVFSARRFDAPRREGFALAPETLRALVGCFVEAGYRELLPRARTQPRAVTDWPNIHYDTFDGEHCYAKWARLRLASGRWVMLPVSYVVASFTACDSLYPEDGSRAVRGLGAWSEIPEVHAAIGLAREALEPLGVSYMPWNSPLLDEPIPMHDLPDATVRDLVFNYEEYE